MPVVAANGWMHSYEQAGEGTPLVFLHGAFADSRVWDSQWQHFSASYRLLRYDLRGHGKTGASTLDRYSMNTFVDDLSSLLQALDIASPVLCGLSWGASIAIAYAARYPQKVRALVLVSPSVSIRLTRMDKLLCDYLFPKWMFLSLLKVLGAKNFTRLTLSLSHLIRGKYWLSKNVATIHYIENCMMAMNGNEYCKIWEAIYGFNLTPLQKISCPLLIINGEYEPDNTYQHTRHILQHVPHAEAIVIPQVTHAVNMDSPDVFNSSLEQFLECAAR